MKEREAKERKRVQEAFMLPEEIETDYLTNNNNKSQHYLNHCDGNDPSVAVATPVSHKRMKKTGTWIFLSHDILKSPDVVSTATRNNVTPTALSEIVKCLISAGGGDPGRVCLNYSTAYRYKVEVCASIAEDVRKTWTPSPFLSVHWDGKLMSALSKCDDKIEEHLPVLFTGTTGTKL